MGIRHVRIGLVLSAVSLLFVGLVVGCTDDDAASPDPGGVGGSAPDGSSSGPDGSVSPSDAGGNADDANTPSKEGGTGSTAALIPTDGGAYFVAAVDGEPMTLMFNLTATRSAGGFATIRGARGVSLPTRDVEIRVPGTVGAAACGGGMSVASIVLRTSDLGGLTTSEPGASCTFDVQAVSAGAGQRVKGTFSGVVKTTDGKTAQIRDGAFDVPTMN